jgi:hypothetical protein
VTRLGECLLFVLFFVFLFIVCAIFWKYQKKPDLGGCFSRGKGHVLILTNIGLGYILGFRFTNTSGHPGWTLNLWAEAMAQLYVIYRYI